MARKQPPYFKLAIGVLDHPKVALLPDAAVIVWVSMIDYAAAYKTDGLVPRPWAERVRGRKMLDATIKAKLVETTADPSQLLVHDYLEWQTSREEQERQSQKQSKNGAKGGRPRHSVTDEKPT